MTERDPPPASPAPNEIPSRITLSAGSLDLCLAMPAGETVVLPAHLLRASCRCAQCVRARIDGVFPEVVAALSIVDVKPIGHYAVNIVFSDGHARGIYPWALLLGLGHT